MKCKSEGLLLGNVKIESLNCLRLNRKIAAKGNKSLRLDEEDW